MLVNIILRMDSVKSGEKYHTANVYRSINVNSMSRVISIIFFSNFRPYFVVQDDYLRNTIEPKTLSQYYAAFLGEQFSEYQKLRIKLGLVALNLENFSSTEQVIRKGDYISSIMHFHERPVLDEKIEVIYENNELLVVNKPASIVVYPLAGYRMNSLLFILAKEYGYMNLRPVHRIDKLTSGVMILSKVIIRIDL